MGIFSAINRLYKGKKNFSALNKELLRVYNSRRKPEARKYLCHAPFKSLLLANNGAVLPCCFNRQAILGQYKDNDLKNIWFGKEAQKLRTLMKKNDLSFGCFVCKTQIFNKEYNTVKARMFDHLPENDNGFPSMIEFDLDNTCNLSCIMCNADNSSQIRKESALYEPQKPFYDEGLIEALKEFIPHLHQASFAGGEPFLIKLYYEIWELMLAIKPQIRINITTNAGVLSNRIKEIIEKGFFEFSVSVDSVSRETYEKIRRNADFNTVMNNLNYLKDYCRRKNTFFGVWVCPLRPNMYEIPDIFHYFNETDTAVYLHTVWVPPGVTLWNLPSDELQSLLNFYKEQAFEPQTQVQHENHRRFLDFIVLINNWLLMAQERERHKSSALEVSPQDEIIQKLKLQLEIKKYSSDEEHGFIGQVNTVFDYCKAVLPSDIYNQAVLYLNTYPGDFIFQIFAAGTQEMICDFFKFLNR